MNFLQATTPEGTMPFNLILLLIASAVVLLFLIIVIIILKNRQLKKDTEFDFSDMPAKPKRKKAKKRAPKRVIKMPNSNSTKKYTVNNFQIFLGYNKVQIGDSKSLHLHCHYHK